MSTPVAVIARVLVCMVLVSDIASSQQDTASFFPLGLWGIYLNDTLVSPWPPRSMTSFQWNREMQNFSDINASYLVAWYPYTMFDMLMNYADTAGYKVDTHLGKYDNPSLNEFGFPSWVTQLRYTCGNPLSQQWKDTVDARIVRLKDTYGNYHQSMWTYFIGHESDFWAGKDSYGNPIPDTCHWKGFEYVINRIKALDPGHKSYVVHWGSRGRAPFPYGTTVEAFARRFPNLSIYQVDDYVFLTSVGKTYDAQQAAIDSLILSYNDCLRVFRDKTTEWHAVVQTQREWVNRLPIYRFRRPTLEELKVQAYLALSRGAKGVTAFVYGSSLPPPGTSQAPVVPPYHPDRMIIDQAGAINDTIYFDGLVVSSGLPPIRQGFTVVTDYEQIPAFANMKATYQELRALGPTIRKLRVYDAFPNTGITSNNIANIASVTGNKIEIGVFKRVDQAADSTVHFMLVNRVCNDASGTPSSPQSITSSFNNTQSKIITEVISGKAWVISPNGSFTDVLNSGGGKLYKLQNANFVQSVTIPSGASLTVQAGATLTFGSGNSLICYGVLSANGTSNSPITFTSGSSWAGLLLSGSGANGSSIQYATINHVLTYGGSALSVNNATGVVVKYSNISGNVNYSTNGIYLYSAGSPEIAYDTLNLNGAYGVVFSSTNGNIYANLIQRNATGGVSCSYSSPSFGKNGFPAYNGNNIITRGNYGVYCGASYPYIGSQQSSYYGYNWVDSSTSARIYANNSNVLAEENWWGSSNPNPSWFVASGGSIDWQPYLQSNPFSQQRPAIDPGGIPKLMAAGIAGSTTDTVSIIRSAVESRVAGNFAQAKTLLQPLLSSAVTPQFSLRAGVELLNIFRETQEPNILTVCQTFLQQSRSSDPALQLIVAEMLGSQSRIPEASSLYKSVASSSAGTDQGKDALIGLFYLYSSNASSRALAAGVANDLKNNYGTDPEVSQALWVNQLQQASAPSVSQKLNEPLTIATAPQSPDLIQNYPNPFNPTTSLQYQLPWDSRVRIVVYDILGREVRVLVDEIKAAGSYAVQFDAISIASGYYFCRMVAEPVSGCKVYTAVKKMMLLK